MLEVKIFTLYPDLFPGPLDIGIFKKAKEKKIWNLKVINIRDYSKDNHGTVDDTPSVSYTHLTLPTTSSV